MMLPGGKHAVVQTEDRRDAFIAICEECGMNFDYDIPAITLAQGVALHINGAGHRRFIYYAIEDVG